MPTTPTRITEAHRNSGGFLFEPGLLLAGGDSAYEFVVLSRLTVVGDWRGTAGQEKGNKY